MADLTAAAKAAGQSAFDAITGRGGEPAPEDPADPALVAAGGTAEEVKTKSEKDESEAESEASGEGTDDVPESYFGVDLSSLPAKERAEFIRTFSEQNKLINQLQRERAATPATPEAPAAPAPAAPAEPTEPPTFSDEDLVQALGIDLDSMGGAELAKTAVPLARLVLDLQDQVKTLSESTSATAEQTFWETGLDRLESEYGNLPVKEGESQAESRQRLYAMAVDEHIGNPEAAYWRFMGPVRDSLQKAVIKQLEAAKKVGKKSATTPRPRTSAATEPAALQSKDTKLAVKEAAKAAAEKLGFDWEDARREHVGGNG